MGSLSGDPDSGGIGLTEDGRGLLSEIESELEDDEWIQVTDRIREVEGSVRDVDRNVREANSRVSEVEQRLNSIDETLRTRERHVHVLPPDTDVDKLLDKWQVIVAVFTLSFGVLRIPLNDTLTVLMIAMGLSVATNAILDYRSD